MIDPSKQIDLNIPSEPISPTTTFTREICLREFHWCGVASMHLQSQADKLQVILLYATKQFACSEYSLDKAAHGQGLVPERRIVPSPEYLLGRKLEDIGW
jgi:hypothetical protein